MMAEGRLDVKPLISHRFALDQAEEIIGRHFSAFYPPDAIAGISGVGDRKLEQYGAAILELVAEAG